MVRPSDPEPSIVLRRFPFGDTSLVVHLFSPARGRIAALAKGAFRAKGPLFGALDLLNEIEASVIAPKHGALGVLGAARVIHSNRRIREREAGYICAVYASELVDSALTESEAPELYIHFQELLRCLDASPPPPVAPSILLMRFELLFLNDLGLAPAFARCAECGSRDLPVGSIGCSVGAGGALCSSCERKFGSLIRFGAADMRAAAALAATPPERAEFVGSAPLRAFLDLFHAYHLARALRSRRSLDAAFDPAGGPA